MNELKLNLQDIKEYIRRQKSINLLMRKDMRKGINPKVHTDLVATLKDTNFKLFNKIKKNCIGKVSSIGRVKGVYFEDNMFIMLTEELNDNTKPLKITKLYVSDN